MSTKVEGQLKSSIFWEDFEIFGKMWLGCSLDRHVQHCDTIGDTMPWVVVWVVIKSTVILWFNFDRIFHLMYFVVQEEKIPWF
jgi:hypothetical protein